MFFGNPLSIRENIKKNSSNSTQPARGLLSSNKIKYKYKFKGREEGGFDDLFFFFACVCEKEAKLFFFFLFEVIFTVSDSCLILKRVSIFPFEIVVIRMR